MIPTTGRSGKGKTMETKKINRWLPGAAEGKTGEAQGDFRAAKMLSSYYNY